MERLKEILFLKNLKRVGKATIYGKYWKILNESDNLDDLMSKIQAIESKFSTEYLKETKEKIEEIYEGIINSDINVITIFDDEYPKQLEIMEKKKPLVLYVKGDVDALTKQSIAIIGTRKPSKLSQEFENDLVKTIVNNSDRVIVSGLALGCDKIAHQATVGENKITVAILPSGVNVVTPASHKELAKNILENGGCLVSEYEPNAKAFKRTYVERDQIVAAFADATFVVECGVKSGTMHTVDAAKKFNRHIFVYNPVEKAKGSYDGNEFILNSNYDAVEVDGIEKFIKDLENMTVNSNNNSKQQKLI